MAEKRMFSMKIIDSDAFLDMPLSTQALYFHLSMRADDDGFLNNAKKIMRNISATQNDYDLLLMKRFIIKFPDGICVIKHWRINNYLRKDRYTETLYSEEMAMLEVKENGSYSLIEESGTPNDNPNNTNMLPNGNQGIPLGDVDKNRVDEDRGEKNIITVSNDTVRCTDVQRIVDAWNSLPGLSRITKLVSGSQRYEWLKVRIRDYGIDSVLMAIENVRHSPFLLGKSKGGWTITFDWFVRPNNFPKVLDGYYRNGDSSETAQPDPTEGGGKKWQ
jgi:hypothetical protein